MRFTVSTKPLKDSLNLAIVNSNVSKFNQLSRVVQIMMSEEGLVINIGNTSIKSEIHLRGSYDGTEPCGIVVDCLLLKNLVNSVKSPNITIEILGNAMNICTDKSKYTLPRVSSIDDAQFPRPYIPTIEDIECAHEVSKGDWKFVKEHQLYALSHSYEQPVYTYVHVDESGDVLVGDMKIGRFSHTQVDWPYNTCLMDESIINLLCSVSDGAKILKHNDAYVVSIVTDSYEFASEFTPQQESDELGFYSTQMIMSLLFQEGLPIISVDVSDVLDVLNQSALLFGHTPNSKDKKHGIFFDITRDGVVISDVCVDCKIDSVMSTVNENYRIKLNSDFLIPLFQKCSEKMVDISPVVRDGTCSGIIVSSGDLTAVLAGMV